MKALELTIFTEYHGSYSRQRMVDGVNTITFHKPAKGKRLTAPELAAEYWRASLDLEFVVSHPDDAGTWDFTTMNEDVRRELILRRFATLPHYDEETHGKSD